MAARKPSQCIRVSRTLLVRRLTPDDRPAFDAFLDRHRATSMFLRANAFHSGLVDGSERFQGLYVGAFADNVLTDVAAHYWNGNIILQAPTQPAELALAVARESGRGVDGVLGPWPQVEAAERALDLGRRHLGKMVPEYLYRLDLADLIVPEQLSTGRVVHRHARIDDLAELVPWQREYELHTLGYPDSRIDDATIHDDLARRIAAGTLWVLEEDGRLVSMTAFNAALPDMVQVGGVFTPVELRSRGHGRSAVAGSLLDARADGVVEAILFTETGNHPGQRAYEALGFERIGQYGMVLLDPLPVQDDD